MKLLMLVYHPKNWKQHHPLPCDWQEVTQNYSKQAIRLLQWPDTHVIATHNANTGEHTETTVGGLRAYFKTAGLIPQ